LGRYFDEFKGGMMIFEPVKNGWMKEENCVL
jgi:hypothetical protein